MDGEGRGLLEDARDAYAQLRWADAFSLLSAADLRRPLEATDLELLAWSAALIADDDALLAALERLYNQQLEAGQKREAALWAFWLGFRLTALGEPGRSGAWLQRARRLCEDIGGDCEVTGYLMIPEAYRAIIAGDLEAAHDHAAAAIAVGERLGDADLVAFARHLQGRVLVVRGKVASGLALLDEAMLSATSSGVNPLITGLIYCSVIATCNKIYALERSREWTAAFKDWCRPQPQLGAFSGICLVHRSEILQVNGQWPEAVAEARRAYRKLVTSPERQSAAAARYQEAELARLTGDTEAAERHYREASQWGWDPQPGLALLRLAQDRTEEAAAAIRRVVGTAGDPLQRARLLPAYAEIAIAVGALDEARTAAEELQRIAEQFATEILGAMAAQARGLVLLAEGDALAAAPLLRQAFAVWQNAGAPYLAARLRVQLGKACGAVGDDEGARLEWDAAQRVFEELGAAPDVAALATQRSRGRQAPGGLTRRELEVLRQLATGKTNRSIAEELHLSGKTVDRHVSNIFDKLGVSSRAAATALAYQRNLL
jgi:DNA-binding CsgD family transcriptional regulator